MSDTLSEREANRMQEQDLIDWYRQELARVKRLARLDSPEVRYTYGWVTQFLRDVIEGRELPVKPPKKPARKASAEFLAEVDAAAKPQRRPTLTLGGER